MRPATRRRIDVAGVSFLAIALVTSMSSPSYSMVWTSARALAPLIVVVGVVALVFVPAARARVEVRPAFFLCVAVAAFMSLVQFPFAAPIYFCYVAPLFVLAAVTCLRYVRTAVGLLPVALLVVYTAFGFVWLDRSAVYRFGLGTYTNPQTVVLDSHRASIRVTEHDRATYLEVTSLLQRHSPGRYVWAGPDAPELYFLTNRRNPTRSFGGRLDESTPQGREFLATLDRHGVTAIAINHRPGFHNNLDALTARMLRQAFPSHAIVGKFEVRWRTDGSEAK